MNMPFPSRSQVDFTRSCCPPGTRIVLSRMNHPFSPVRNSEPVVPCDMMPGQVGVTWDNGRSLSLIPGVDSFRKLTQQEIAQEQAMTMYNKLRKLRRAKKKT